MVMNVLPPALPCVHIQERHNFVKTPTAQVCPWCKIDALETRLRKAESMIADVLSRWNARDSGYWREQQLRMQMYEEFLKPGTP